LENSFIMSYTSNDTRRIFQVGSTAPTATILSFHLFIN
jgi:hypothetical protein